jgi:hypothetical protein
VAHDAAFYFDRGLLGTGGQLLVFGAQGQRIGEWRKKAKGAIVILPLAGGILFAALISLPAWVLLARAIPHGPPSLLKAWGIGFGIKILLGMAGIWAVIRLVEVPLRPFLWALLISYMVLLAVEILWATRRIRRLYPKRTS